MITIRIEGAGIDDIERGLRAAQAVFDRAGVTAAQAADARFDREGWDIGSFAAPAPHNLDIADLWDEADATAVAACCAAWPQEKVPASAGLQVVYKDAPGDEEDDDESMWAGGKEPDWIKEAAARGDIPELVKGR